MVSGLARRERDPIKRIRVAFSIPVVSHDVWLLNLERKNCAICDIDRWMRRGGSNGQERNTMGKVRERELWWEPGVKK